MGSWACGHLERLLRDKITLQLLYVNFTSVIYVLIPSQS